MLASLAMNSDHHSEISNLQEVHPHWNALIRWLSDVHGMDISIVKLPVVARASVGAGYGLFSLRAIGPSEPLFSIPAKALMNALTLAPHYPPARPRLTCTQIVSLHLMLHRPLDGHESSDPLFGPYISVLPQNFDSHPFTWLWKYKRDATALTLENKLVQAMPDRVMAKLEKMSGLYGDDWAKSQDYLRENPTVFDGATKNAAGEEDYLWGWLNVNTRCVYHRLAKRRSDKDNMTLCPILDFANHTTKPPFTNPKTTNAELWDTGPSPKRKFGDNFVLLSPSDTTTSSGEELYLRYGVHSNATLFSEYGFVNHVDTEGPFDEYSGGEVELGKVIEDLFEKRGSVGAWMKEILIEEGYWGDWTLHASPAPAHPSYRVTTTLRLYHVVPTSVESIPPNAEQLIKEWRDTTLGRRPNISEDNEKSWRKTLRTVCIQFVREAMAGFKRLTAIDGMEGSPQPQWLKSSKAFIETLWREDVDVATSVVESIQRGEEF